MTPQRAVAKPASSPGLPPALLQLLLASNPDALASTGADGLLQIVATLASTLEIPPELALQLLAKRPALLQPGAHGAALLSRCEQLSIAMSLPTSGRDSGASAPLPAVVRTVCRQPALLDVAPEDLAAAAARAAAVMGVGKGEAAAMLARSPDAGCLVAVLAMPGNAMRQQLIDMQAVLDSRCEVGLGMWGSRPG